MTLFYWQRRIRARVAVWISTGILISAMAGVSIAGGDSSSRPASPGGGKEMIAKGQQLFTQACSPCHGGSGEGGEGPSLHNLKLSKEDIEAIVKRGFPSEMPSFAKRFQQPDLDRIAAYILSLH